MSKILRISDMLKILQTPKNQNIPKMSNMLRCWLNQNPTDIKKVNDVKKCQKYQKAKQMSEKAKNTIYAKNV